MDKRQLQLILLTAAAVVAVVAAALLGKGLDIGPHSQGGLGSSAPNVPKSEGRGDSPAAPAAEGREAPGRTKEKQ
jgi:hypothetical protein